MITRQQLRRQRALFAVLAAAALTACALAALHGGDRVQRCYDVRASGAAQSVIDRVCGK